MLGIGPWLWIDEGWAQPGMVGAIDFASHAQLVEAKPGAPRAVGIFRFSPDADTREFINAGGVLLSSDDPRDAKPDSAGLDAAQRLTGYRPQGDTWSDCLKDWLTTGADPENIDFCGPIEPTHLERLEIWLGDKLHDDRFRFGTDAYSNKLAAAIRSRLHHVRIDAQSGGFVNSVSGLPDSQFHRRIADAVCEKFAGRNPNSKRDLWSILKPKSWDAGESLLPHQTLIIDDFTRADGTTIGDQLTWTEVLNDVQTKSNAVIVVTTAARCDARAESDLSSTDHFGQIDAITLDYTSSSSSRLVRACCRYSSSANTNYAFVVVTNNGSPGTNQILLAKLVAGTSTTIGGPTNESETIPGTFRVNASGTTISGYAAGVSKFSVTDSSITTGTRCGFAIRSEVATSVGASVDNFRAADLTFTATAADTIGPMTCAASATFTSPGYHGTSAVSIGHMTCSAVATFTKPTYHGTAAVSSAPMTCSAQAQHYFAHPVGKLTRPMLGIFTRRYKSFAGKLAYSATAAAAIGAMLCSGSAAFAKPTYTGSAADSAGPMTCQAFATQTLPTIFSASVSVTIGPTVCSASATFDATVNLGDSDICLDLQRCPRVFDLQRRPIVLDLGDR